MAYEACTQLLQWALPQLGLRWRGFRRVRRQACRRIEARRRALGLDDLAAYRERLERDPSEWQRLDAMCRITISRFWRNREVFESIPAILAVLSEAARAEGRSRLAIWSAGCASGEEPFSVSIAGADFDLEIVATDADRQLLERARRGRYEGGTLRELSAAQRDVAFDREGDAFEISARHRARVRFLEQDVRRQTPPGRFDMVLCRNLAFTYFDEALQVVGRLVRSGHADAAELLRKGLPFPGGGQDRDLEPVSRQPARRRRAHSAPGCRHHRYLFHDVIPIPISSTKAHWSLYSVRMPTGIGGERDQPKRVPA